MRYTTSGRISRALAVAAPVPGMILLTALTRGGIEPHLPGQSDTWNIQYLPLCTIAVLVAVMTVRWRRMLGPTLTFLIAGLNALVAAIAVYAIITLWGEKY